LLVRQDAICAASPSYNNIGFQPQILKKAGVGFASGAEAIHGVAVPWCRQGF